MSARDHNARDGSGQGKEGAGELSKAGKLRGDDCRCKETSQMTPRQLLGLMLSDLAFWMKPDAGKHRKP